MIERSEDEITCPVCRRVGKEPALDSLGVFITSVKAFRDGDDATLEALYSSYTPFDAHNAISLYVEAFETMCALAGRTPEEVLAEWRQDLDERLSRG